jgi:hypothetical protein
MTDLFAWTPGAPPGDQRQRKTPVPKGHAGTPGLGPAGETCGSCGHLHRSRIPRRGRPGASRVYLKCDLMREHWNREGAGRATDVRAKDAACSFWEKNE